MINLKTFYIAILIAVSYFTAAAQVKSKTNSNTTIAQLHKQLETVIQKENIPGLMVSIVKNDNILYAGGLGYADLGKRRPVDQLTQFHLASVTKFFVAMGIQQLVAKGRLKLSDRIRDIAPEIPFNNPWEDTYPVRVVHLLEHTAGFDDVQLNSMVTIGEKPLLGIDAIKAVSNSLTVRWKPGTMMSYSNPGYNVLGYIIEKVTDMPWDKYLQDQIFLPLNMRKSLFDRNGTRMPNFATGYDFRDGKFRPMPFYQPGSNGAGSALVSNAEDMAKFMLYLLNGSADSTLLNNGNLNEMEIIHSTLASQAGLQTGYALGNDLFPNNKRISLRGHNGKGEGFVSWLFFNRDAGIAYAIAANSVVNMWPISQAIEDFLTKNISPPKLTSHPIDKQKLKPLLGYYQFMNPKNDRWEFYRRIFGGIELRGISKDRLLVKKENGQVDSLIHIGNGIFRAKDDILPSFVLAKDSNDQPFFQGYGNNFYRKVPPASLLIQKIPIYLGFCAILIYMIFSLVGIVLMFFRKIKLIDVGIPLLPIVGTCCFIAAYRLMGLTDASHKELFTSFNITSFLIFLGMLSFAILVIVSSLLLYKRWFQLTPRWLRLLLAFCNFFLCYLVALLSINGWIGVPIWMM
ncbi:class A beta-lactamase-related serine hydrolase [Sphingobacterium puteale]|uniref:Class A beta-lactamase-related serine hydrolase n=1 Tax=Sphingobacterium puteale TaxID=2420510 RepID=A0A420VV17_9SPHI|nr:serine hydrolase domain-containing protein [Sphingobacterium puteale]RKO70174.1 class A beta-lactamase-related serine hydrolase [Sphingobacterium puteale]